LNSLRSGSLQLIQSIYKMVKIHQIIEHNDFVYVIMERCHYDLTTRILEKKQYTDDWFWDWEARNCVSACVLVCYELFSGNTDYVNLEIEPKNILYHNNIHKLGCHFLWSTGKDHSRDP
jgi:hypothetical protein